MVRRVGQQLVQSSLLFEGQDFPRFNQLWMHPIVSAATSALQQPRLDQLLQDGQTDALGLLLWYGADSFGPMETATHRPLSVCEAAAATVLPMEGQRQFVSSVRQAMRSSSHLAALWHQCPEQATLLLRSLATLDAVAVSRVSYGLLQRDRGQLQQVTLPTRQAVRLKAGGHALVVLQCGGHAWRVLANAKVHCRINSDLSELSLAPPELCLMCDFAGLCLCAATPL